MSFVTKPPPGKDQPHGQIPPVVPEPPPSSNLPNFMAAAAQATSNPKWNYNNLHAQATSLYVQQVAASSPGQSWSKASFQSIAQRFELNDQTQAHQTPPSTTPSVTISKVPATVPPSPVQPQVQSQALATNNSSPPKPAEVPPQQVPTVQPLQTNMPQLSSVGNNVVPQKNIITSPKVSESAPPPPLKKTTSPVTLPPVPVSHQKQLSIVQKTPTKSTLRLATVTPRIKTTPKKSPTQLAPKSPVPTDRPNALIKQKDLSPPQTAPAKPALPVAPNVPSKSPSPLAAIKESPPPPPPPSAPLPKETAPKTTPKETEEKQCPNEVKESPKASPPKPAPAPNTKPESKSPEKKPVEKSNEKIEKPQKIENEKKEKPQKEAKVPKETKPEVKEKETTKRAVKAPKTPASSAAELEKRAKRMRKEVQPFQSPIPEIENVKKLSIATLSPSNKNSEDKLILFYKNEFLAVRNAEGSFYLCQANHNVTKKGQKIKIRWLNQDKPSSRIYAPDYYDQTDFECVLTTVELEKSGKNNYKISEEEQNRVEHILKNALDVEKGIAPKPEITEENPDGLDLSIFTSESQLDRSASMPVKTPKNSKNSTKKRQRESIDDDSDEDFTPLSKVAKTKTLQRPGTAANGRGRNRKPSVVDTTTTTTTPAPPSTTKKTTRGKKDDGDPLGITDRSIETAISSKTTKKTVKANTEKKEPVSTRTTRTRK